MRRIVNAESGRPTGGDYSRRDRPRRRLAEFPVGIQFICAAASICVSIIVAFAQMVTLAVGQMNLSVGALGGMVAVLFGGMMEVLGVPLWLAVPPRSGSAVWADWSTVCWRRAPGIDGFIVSATDGLCLHRRKPWPHQIRAVLQDADRSAGLWQWPDWSASVAHRPTRASRCLPCFCSCLPIGRWLRAVGGNSQAAALSGISPAHAIVLAHCLSGF